MNTITAREAIAEHVATMLAGGKITQDDMINFLRAGNAEISKRIESSLDSPMDASEARGLALHIFTEIV